jgi:hypothetical protein
VSYFYILELVSSVRSLSAPGSNPHSEACRKRRIKCDEGRPICNNCIKSKRQCEGYNQRVIFKEPMGAYHGGPYGAIPYTQQSSEDLVNQLVSAQSKSLSQSGPPLPVIAPKPPAPDLQGQVALNYGQAYQGQPGPSASAGFNFNHAPYGSDPAPHTPSLTSPISPLQAHDHGAGRGYMPPPHTADGRPFGHGDFAGTEQPATVSSSAEEHRQMADQPLDETVELQYALSDDDTSMIESDDEIQDDPRERSQFGSLVASHLNGPLASFSTDMRSFSSYASDGILQAYTPSARNSPLTDKRTAAVFWHFVNVTGPSMSLYERHAMDHSKLSQAGPQSNVAAAHNIWTCRFILDA